MTGALVILAVTIVTGLILWLTHKPDATDAPAAGPEPQATEDDVCCGRHAVCEKKKTAAKGPEYFDDEELDAYAGRSADTYTDEETEQFRTVLYTLIPSEVYAWGVALERRGVALPASLRDEWMMLCSDSSETPPQTIS